MNKHTGKIHIPDYMIYEEAIPQKDNDPLFRSVTTLECMHEGCLFILRDDEIIEYIRTLEKNQIF